MEAHFRNSMDYRGVGINALKMVCEFYNGDWAGVILAELDLSIWRPHWWYKPEDIDRTDELVHEFESCEGLERWIQCIRDNEPLVVSDIEAIKDSYANQCKYRKIDGTPPGEEIQRTTLSVTELGQLLGISEASAYVLISKGHFEQVPVLGKMRITRDSFEQWYKTQCAYRTDVDQALDDEQMQTAYTMPDIGRLLGLHRNQVYYLVAKNLFETVQIGNRKCITKASFHHWYEGQSHYKLVAEDGVQEGRD